MVMMQVPACGRRRPDAFSREKPQLSVYNPRMLNPTEIRPILKQWVAKAMPHEENDVLDRKSTRLNSSHLVISYAVFCLKKKKQKKKKKNKN